MAYLERNLPDPGDAIGGKYRIVRRIGEGGMGVVFEAIHERIQQRVALKMLLPEVLEIEDVVSRFEREARAAGQLRSENAARVVDVDITQAGIPYMVMEFLDGNDLSQVLDARTRLPVAESVDYVLQACNAMAEAHALGIIHRDLKPSNLFLCGGERPIVKVLDFGISKLQNEKDTRVTSTQATVGTPLYMSPEQIRSAKHVDTRTDIWSLSVILYELLTGKTPFEGSTASAAAAICIDDPPRLDTFRPDVPHELEAIIRKGLAKKPDDRYADVQALAAAIAPFGGGTVRLPRASQASLPFVVTQSTRPRLASAAEEALVSARTMAAEGEPRPVSRQGATMPGWTTQSRAGKSRNRLWLVLPAIGAAFGLLGLAVAVMRPPTANGRGATSAVAPTLVVTPSVPVQSLPVDEAAASVAPLPSLPVASAIKRPPVAPRATGKATVVAPPPSAHPQAVPITPSTSAPIHI